MGNIPDRRNAQRSQNTSVVLHREYVLAPNKPSYTEDRLVNLSTEGLSFATKIHYQEGVLLEVRLLLIGWENFKTDFYFGDARKASDPLVALAKVVRVRPLSQGEWKVGLKIETIDESHRSALKAYLQKTAKEQ